MAPEEEFCQAMTELKTWARLVDAEHSVWQALVVLDKYRPKTDPEVVS